VQKLKALDTRHKAACRMRIEGKKNDEIARDLNVSKRTLVVWFSDDLVKEYLEFLAENVEQAFAVELARGGMIAISELVRMIQMPDRDSDVSVHTKIELAREILSRLPGTATNHDRAYMEQARTQAPQGGSGDTNILNVIGQMDNRELAAFVNGGWQAGLPSGDVD
jgi:hypothetical protein